jgi:hypothetical protein
MVRRKVCRSVLLALECQGRTRRSDRADSADVHSTSGGMSGMVSAQDVPGDDPCTIAGIRAIDERDEGLVELEITVSCSPGARGRTG